MKILATVTLLACFVAGCEKEVRNEAPLTKTPQTMEHLSTFLDSEGDSYDKVSDIASVIQERIDKKGLDAWDSPDSDLDQVSTWEERAIVRLMSFYSVCSNNGRVYPHVDFGLSLIPEFEAVCAHSTVKALRELDALRDTGFELRDDERVAKIEHQVPGDFAWADPILDYVKANQGRFLKTGG